MTHQPYLDWILTDSDQPAEKLSQAEQAALQEHLQACPECSRMSRAWQAVEGELKAAPEMAPVAGFSARWRTRLEAERLRQHHRQGIRIAVASLAASLALLAVLVYMAWPLLRTPQLLAWTYLYQVLRLVSIFGTLGQFSRDLLRASAPAAPFLIWAMAAAALLAAMWFVVYRLLTGPQKIKIWSKPK